MVDNTTELLRIIVNNMSHKGIELTDVKIYEEAVDINNQVKVCVTNNGFLIHRVNEGGGTRESFNGDMVDRVLELLKPTISKGDYITDGESSGRLINVGNDEYHVVNLKDNETIHCQTCSLEALQNMGWEKV